MARRALRFVHLSDLHFIEGADGRAEREAHQRARIVEDLTDQVQDGLRVDAVLVTGDIAFAGKPEQYRLADEWLDAVADVLGLSREKILVCPGNHDVDRALIAEEHRGHREDLRTAADNLLDQSVDKLLAAEGRSVLDPLRSYSEFAAGRQCGLDRSLSWKTSIPFGDGYVLEIRGAASVINSSELDGAGTMVVHSNQIRAAREAGVAHLLMIHHSPHFWRVPEPGPGECGQHVVLYGHTHQPHTRTVDNCVEVTAGAIHPDETADRPDSAYNILEFAVTEEDPGTATAVLELVVRKRSCTATKDHYADAGSEQLSVRLPMAVAGAPANGDDSDQQPTADQAELPDEADTVATEPEERSPLESEGGGSDPRRAVTLAIEELGFGRRIQVLRELGMWTAERSAMGQDELIRSAAEEIVDRGRIEEFNDAAVRARS